jgi:hypothetical protein
VSAAYGCGESAIGHLLIEQMRVETGHEQVAVPQACWQPRRVRFEREIQRKSRVKWEPASMRRAHGRDSPEFCFGRWYFAQRRVTPCLEEILRSKNTVMG